MTVAFGGFGVPLLRFHEHEALENETFSQTINFKTQDTREAMLAFVKKTSPTFTGR